MGAGYVELASHPNVLKAVSCLCPEVVLATVDKIPEISATVLLAGCGLSTDDKAIEIFKTALSKNLPSVIDADGLNILAKKQEILNQNDKKILTPHPKEASRLLGCKLEDVLEDMETSAKKISERYNCVTALKSHRTIVTDGKEIYINQTGNSALAKAGSGDVLAGMIAGLLAQNMALFDAAALGVYLHGLAGDIAKNDLTAYGVLASDTVRYIPLAIKKYLSEEI